MRKKTLAGRGTAKWEPTGFAERLRALREERGLTQQALGDLTGCHKITIAKLEAGAQEPSWPLVRMLRDALGCELSDFEPPPKRKPGRPRKGDGGG